MVNFFHYALGQYPIIVTSINNNRYAFHESKSTENTSNAIVAHKNLKKKHE